MQALGAVLILALLVRQLGAGPFLVGLRGLGPGTLLAALAIGAATTVCSAWRWSVVARALGVGLPLPTATAAYYRSQFLNSVLPGGVLGDVHRGVRHGLDAGDLGRGLRAVVWDRAAGQVVQAALTVVVLLALPSPVHAWLPLVVPPCAAALAVALIAGRVLARRGSGRMGRFARMIAVEMRTLLHRTTWPTVTFASVLVVGGYLGTFLLAAHAAGAAGSPLRWLPPAFVVLLASSIPFNVAGWGPREGVAVWVFAAAGLGAGTGAAVATAFGVLTLVSTVPGAAVLLADRRRRPRRSPPADREPERAAGGVLSRT